MAKLSETSNDIDNLYDYGERLNASNDKSQLRSDYEGILSAANGSMNAKQLAVQLIPKYFKYFPHLADKALDQHLYLCEDDELGNQCLRWCVIGEESFRKVRIWN